MKKVAAHPVSGTPGSTKTIITQRVEVSFLKCSGAGACVDKVVTEQASLKLVSTVIEPWKTVYL